MTEWVEKNLEEIVEINPSESIKKGQVAKKIPMDKLQPNCRDIPGLEFEPYSGGAKFRNKDTIMARITPCLENGKIAQVNILDEGEIGFGSTEFLVFRARKGNDANFIYYLVSSPIVREPAIKSMVGSSGRQRVQTDVVKKLRIKVPSLCEQEAIAGILKSLDDKIFLNNTINHNLEQQAQTIFKKWFIGKNIGFKDVSLSTLMSYAGGSQPPASEFIAAPRDGYVRFVQIRDYETDGHVTYIPISSKNKLCEETDIMIARYGASLGRICFGLNGAYNVALAKVFPKKPYYREFLRCYLSSRDFYEGINNRGGRSAQAGFNESDIRSFILSFPCDDVLVREFENVASPMFAQRLSLLKENRKLVGIRDTLLPKLMSGEIDVSKVKI